ncbi:hypothetical protein GN958_ATG05679 [Phytophthora infestans]|uniref:Uncharacterized protein n=1 Tax=Phytophthora infestans TaxID=4787 RepID=A0A8S9UVN4_PHYIN|nr:hypothetical protein GN958_ATG05679 [Phytophthora infestans]
MDVAPSEDSDGSGETSDSEVSEPSRLDSDSDESGDSDKYASEGMDVDSSMEPIRRQHRANMNEYRETKRFLRVKPEKLVTVINTCL